MSETAYTHTLAAMPHEDRLAAARDAAALMQRGVITDRQYDIMCRRAYGASHATIAAALGLSRQRVAQIEKRTLTIMNAEAEKGEARS